MRKLLALVLGVALLALTACGSGTPKSVGAVEPLSSIKVTPGADDNTAPKVEFDTPMKATAPGAKVIEEGDGATIKAGQDVTYKMSGYNTQDGKEIGNTFTDPAMTLSLVDELKQADAEIYDILVGTKVGSWVAYVRPDDTAAATEGESKSAEPAEAAQVLVLKVVGAKDKPAPKITFNKEEGDAKKGAEASATLDDDGLATVKIPAGNEPPADLKVTTLKEGDGAKVKKTDTVTVNYAGATWSDGKQFDSSYDRGEPATFGLNQVIKGWTQGLEGVKVGSTVLLTIPGKLAYDGSAGKPQGTLVFIVEVTKADAAAK
ncbi:FKBP-type peptidyl-prolyl cis-trans isomerase [Arthrobacter sp.]|uniref:FKBP-type peptidyl-prolyl cis-trans isomerase n=1 Tax=Arthrobacter sp. TaxID=1667 RepID=UPI003A92B0FF